MPIFTLSNAVRGAMADAVLAAIDAGSGPAQLRFYTGTIPGSPDDAVTSQTLLGTLTCSDPCGVRTGGTIQFSSITQDASADATGTATWARLVTSAGTAVADFDVTSTSGTGAIRLNTVDIVAGGTINVTYLSLTMGGVQP